MFKAIILLRKRSEDHRGDFSDWWLNQHALLARQLPGLIKATFNVVLDDEQPDYDGVSELWFESREDFDRAYASEIGQKVVADSEAHVSMRTRLLCDEIVIKE